MDARDLPRFNLIFYLFRFRGGNIGVLKTMVEEGFLG